jgi:hypothetical protein
MTIAADAQDARPVTLTAARAEFDADVTYLLPVTAKARRWHGAS